MRIVTWLGPGLLLLLGAAAEAQPAPETRPPPPPSLAAPGQPGWAVDPQTGCWLWNARPRPGETVQWTGACPNGPAEGEGTATWIGRQPDGRPRTESYQGSLREGRPEGRGIAISPTGQRYEGDWHAGRPHGRGRVSFADGGYYDGEWRDGRPDGQGEYLHMRDGLFVGTWREGCFREGERIAGIGRPAESCR